MNKPAILNAPEQWAVVPVEPTNYMTRKGSDAVSCLSHAGANAVYAAMTYSSPSPNILGVVAAYVAELERELRIAIEQRNMTLTEMQGQTDRAEAAEARLAQAEKVMEPFARAVEYSRDLNSVPGREATEPRQFVLTSEFHAARAFMEKAND